MLLNSDPIIMPRMFIDFDIDRLDSGQIDLGAPQRLSRLLKRDLRSAPPATFGSMCNIEQIEDLRLQLLSDAVISSNLLKDFEAQSASKLKEAVFDPQRGLGAPLRHLAGGLVYLDLGSWLVISMPRVIVLSQGTQLLNSLSLLHDLHHNSGAWIFDFSAMTEIPTSVLAYLIGLRGGSGIRACKLVFLWLQKEACSKELLEPLQEMFNLQSRGAFLLSR